MIDIRKLWHDACSNIIGIKGINAIAYSVWIDSLTPLCVKDNVLILLAPSSNNKLTVNKTYKEAITAALSLAGSMITEFTVITDEEKEFYAKEIAEYSEKEESPEEAARDTKSQFIARYTFDNFVVGESN